MIHKSRTHSLTYKIISIILLLVIVISTLSPGLFVSADDGNKATYKSEFLKDGVNIELNKTIIDNQNGYFSLKFDATSYLNYQFKPQTYSYTEDGVFTAPRDGYYLVQLWGGKGGDGGDGINHSGGDGGRAGYVYGCLYLTENQALVYTIGTSGQSAQSVNQGGGENEGGDKEGFSTFPTGGGGGYSALYFFNSSHEATITEQERLNDYVMIAAGGGGGGAANQLLLPSYGYAHGGDGGRVLEGLNGHLTEADNHGIAGTWFGGQNGSSSGTSTAYVGRGGTNYVGGITSGYVETTPNDWIGTYISGVVPGNGGNGMWRGGAGGAGFCGGSGGAQTALLLGSNVGGGGGGSSFIADTYKTTYTNENYDNVGKVVWKQDELSNSILSLLKEDANSKFGGRCSITYVGTSLTEDKGVDTEPYKNATATVEIAEYFEVVSKSANMGTLTQTSVAAAGEYRSESTLLTVSNVDISPDAYGDRDKKLELTVLVRPKADFAGGNMVTMFSEQFTLAPDFSADITTDRTMKIGENTSTDYVNAPLNVKLVTRSYSSSDNTKSYPVTSLYEDSYKDVRENYKSMWQYDFIYNIGEYEVIDKTTGIRVTGNVTPKETTHYTVTITVSLDSYSTSTSIGKPITSADRTVSKDAVITILEPDTLVEENVPGLNNKVTVTAGRTLNYAGDRKFEFGIETRQSMPAVQSKFDASAGNYTFTVPDGQDGWYYVEALGAGGGGSGSCTLTGGSFLGSSGRASGGLASVGGYTGGYIHLSAGDSVTFTLGSKGTTSSPSSQSINGGGNYYLATDGGTAGGNTAVYLERNGVSALGMVAGGGGGAGGSALADHLVLNIIQARTAHGRQAVAGAVCYAPYGTEAAISSQATDGTRGTTSGSGTGVSAQSGKVGAPADNYVSDAFCVTGDDIPLFVQTTYRNSQRISIDSSEGKGAVTCIITDDNLEAIDVLSNGFSAEGAMTRYFDIVDIDMRFEADNVTYTDTVDADGYTVRTYSQPSPDGESAIAVANFSFKYVTKTDGSGESYTYYDIRDAKMPLRTTPTEILSDPTFVITLAPVEGFIGGNDVPVVKYGVLNGEDVDVGTDYGVKVGRNTQKMFLMAQEKTDYANVPLFYDFKDENFQVVSEYTMTGVGTISVNDLLLVNEIPLPSGADAWLSEFVETSTQITANPQSAMKDTEITINETTVVDFTQIIRPKAEAQKATVVLTLDDATVTKKSTVSLQCSINTVLEHVVYQGPDKINWKTELEAMLTPEEGYQIDQLTVMVGSRTLDNDTIFDMETGKLTIPANSITDNITIEAVAVPKPYKLTFMYVDPESDIHPSEYGDDTPLLEHVEEYYVGDTIDYTQWYEGFNAGINQDKWTGYQFVWEWPTEDGMPMETMPGYDYYVMGIFMKRQYTLTVNYVKEGTVFDTHTEKVAYGDMYSVESPLVNGYLADNAVVSGTMGAGDVEVNVAYTAQPNTLNIISIRNDRDGLNVINTYSQVYNTDEAYSVDAATFAGGVVGYTPNQDVVSGTMTAEGVTVYVYFAPNSYYVTFNGGEGAVLNANGDSTITRAVQYNNLYSYDPSIDKYVGLPTPHRNGYDFVGWFTAAEGGEQIFEEDIVAVTDDSTVFYAQWIRRAFTVTVYFRDEQGNNLAAPQSEEKMTGESYSFTALSVQDYYTDVDQVSGTVGNSNIVHTIVYHPITYSLSVRVHIYGEKEANTFTTHTLRQDANGNLTFDTTSTTTDIQLSYNQKFSYINPVPKYLSSNKLKQYHLTSYSINGGSGSPAGIVDDSMLETIISGTMGRDSMSIDLYYEVDTTQKYIFSVEFRYAYDDAVPAELQGKPMPGKKTISKSCTYGEKVDLTAIEKEIGSFDVDGYGSYLAVDLTAEVDKQVSAAYYWKALTILTGGSFTMEDSNMTLYIVYIPLSEEESYTLRIHREFYESIPEDIVENHEVLPPNIKADYKDIDSCYEKKFLDFDQIFPKEQLDGVTYIPLYLRIEAEGTSEIVLLDELRYQDDYYLNGVLYERNGEDNGTAFSVFDPNSPDYDPNTKIVVMYKLAATYSVTIEFLEGMEDGTTKPMAGKDPLVFNYSEGTMLDPADFKGMVDVDVDGYAAYLFIPGLTGDTMDNGAVPGAYWNILLQMKPQELNAVVNSDIVIQFIYVPLTDDEVFTFPIHYEYANDEELVPDSNVRGKEAAPTSNNKYYEGQWITYDELFANNIEHYMPSGVLVGAVDGSVEADSMTMSVLKAELAGVMADATGMPADYFREGIIYSKDVFGDMDVEKGGTLKVTLLYEAREYTAGVIYQYSDLVENVDNPIIGSFQITRRYGSDAEIITPVVVEGYKPSMNEIVIPFSGDIEENREYIVYYFDENTEITDVTIDIGDMIFDYSSAIWNPDTHQYESPMTATIAGMEISGIIPPRDESNKLTITNNGTTPINALIEYQIASSLYYELMAALTDEAMETPYIGSVDIREMPSGHHQSYYLWLVGHINVKKFIEESSHLTVGRVIVTIGNGGGE